MMLINEEDVLQKETEQETNETAAPEEGTIEGIKCFHTADENTLYDAFKNDDGSYTLFSKEGEDLALSAEEFETDWKLYQEPEQAAKIEPDIPQDPELDINPDEIDDPDQLKVLLSSLQERLREEQARGQANEPQVAVPQGGLPEHRVANAAETLINGLYDLGAGTFRGLGSILNRAKSSIENWQGRQRIQELHDRMDTAIHHLNTIAANPDFKKQMAAIESGVKTNEDVRNDLFERFTSKKTDTQSSELNLAYHNLLSQMSKINQLDYKLAEDSVDLSDEVQSDLFVNLKKKVDDFKEREELKILPNENNETLMENIKEMTEQIKQFFIRVVQKFTGAQSEPAVSDSAAPAA